MNIVTPIPTAIPFTTSNVNTESARRDNALRETIPQPTQSENSPAEAGVGNESERSRTAAQVNQQLTYDRATLQQNAEAAIQDQNNAAQQDNADDPSAGRENAEERQKEQQEAAEQQKVQELKERDREVRAHEQAHASVGGQYAGSPSYEFETGPDGQQYAVGGEVSIDISEASDPEETLRKMQQVRAAALAPNEPSPQDLRVAGEAARKAQEARADIAAENTENLQASFDRVFSEEGVSASPEVNEAPELDEIVNPSDITGPTRSLEETPDPVAEAVGLETGAEEFRREQTTRDAEINARALRIEGFYQQVSQPRISGLQQTA